MFSKLAKGYNYYVCTDAALSRREREKGNFNHSLPSCPLISCWYLSLAELNQEPASKNANRGEKKRKKRKNSCQSSSGQRRVEKHGMDLDDGTEMWIRRIIGISSKDQTTSSIEKYPVSFGNKKRL